MSLDTLFNTVQLGSLSLPNRVAMAPMTRARAGTDGVPTSSMATYYAQRASAGLIVAEAINISADAVGSAGTPGIWTEAQIEGWRTVTNAVHAEDGHIVAQLWHTGRVGHSVERGGAIPVAPSALRIEGQQHHTSQGRMDYEVPRALATHEVKAIVDDYGRAASAALEAGFDAVELHAAFGYLPNQFLVDGANHRTDRYGGSVENRVRFVVDAMQAMIEAVGPDRVGIKLSPTIPFNGMVDTDPVALYGHLIERLNPMGPALRPPHGGDVPA